MTKKRGQRVYDTGVRATNLGILGVGLGTKAGLLHGGAQFLGSGGKHGGLAAERVLRESLLPVPSLNPKRWKHRLGVFRQDRAKKAAVRATWQACVKAAKTLGVKPPDLPRTITGGGSVLNHPGGWLRRKLFTGPRAQRVAKRASESRLGPAFRAMARFGERMNIRRLATKSIRVGGALALGGIGLQVAGGMMGGRPWRSNVERR